MELIRAALEKAIEEAINGDTKFIATLEIPSQPEVWMQLSWDRLHFAYPTSVHPEKLLQQISLPPFVELSEWIPNESATFSHGAQPIEELASFAECFFRLATGQNSSELTVSNTAVLNASSKAA